MRFQGFNSPVLYLSDASISARLSSLYSSAREEYAEFHHRALEKRLSSRYWEGRENGWWKNDTEFANAAGVTRSVAERLRNGRNPHRAKPVGIDTLKSMANRLGVNYADITAPPKRPFILKEVLIRGVREISELENLLPQPLLGDESLIDEIDEILNEIFTIPQNLLTTNVKFREYLESSFVVGSHRGEAVFLASFWLVLRINFTGFEEKLLRLCCDASMESHKNSISLENEFFLFRQIRSVLVENFGKLRTQNLSDQEFSSQLLSRSAEQLSKSRRINCSSLLELIDSYGLEVRDFLSPVANSIGALIMKSPNTRAKAEKILESTSL